MELSRSNAEDYDKLANFTREFVDKKMAELIKAGELDDPEERADVLTQGEEILANYEAARKEIEKHRHIRRVREERKKYLSDGKKTDKEFSHEKIAAIITEWCEQPNTEYSGEKYERERRNASMLANITGLDKKTLTSMAAPKGRSIPKRETLLAVAVAMKLSKEKRLQFMIYSDPRKEYPGNDKEEVLEDIIDTLGINAGFKNITDEYYKRTGTTLPSRREKQTTEKEK